MTLLRTFLLLLTFVAPAAAQVDCIEIVKHKRELNLIKDDKVLKTFRISLGRQPKGHKLEKDDSRTPEGTYFIKRKMENTDFNKSLLISYPNPEDIKQAQETGVDPGDHLCIHGMRSYLYYLPTFLQKTHRFVDWTRGCIGLTDEEIEEIYAETDIGTPVIIFE